MTLSITIFSIDTQHNEIQHNDTQHSDTKCIVLNVTYAECHLCQMPFMLSVTNKPIMLSVIMLNAIILNVVAPYVWLG